MRLIRSLFLREQQVACFALRVLEKLLGTLQIEGHGPRLHIGVLENNHDVVIRRKIFDDGIKVAALHRDSINLSTDTVAAEFELLDNVANPLVLQYVLVLSGIVVSNNEEGLFFK